MKTEDTLPFPNPTTIEAICEFHFNSQGNAQKNWDGKWYGRLHSALGADYEMEPKTAKGVIVQASNDGKPTLSENLISINQMLYKHKFKDQLIQLAPWLLAINEIGHYPGWKLFLDHIEHGWQSLSSVIDPLNVTQIGIRYINRIPKESPEEPVGDWINKNDMFPKRILVQCRDFFLRCEIPLAEEIKMVITVTEEQTNAIIKPIIFDIDAKISKKHDSDWSEIKNSLNLLHKYIREEFDNSQTEKLKAYLNKPRITK